MTNSTDWSGELFVMVEVPKGSRNKYEYDDDRGVIKLDRFLFTSVVYPTDYGFIPETLGADGDPLDALVCVSEPTFPGCHIPVRAVALLDMSDEKGQDEKIVCVPCNDPNWSAITDLDVLPQQLRSEISHFFSIYKQPEGKPVAVHGWRARDDAAAAIEQARQRFGRRAEQLRRSRPWSRRARAKAGSGIAGAAR